MKGMNIFMEINVSFKPNEIFETVGLIYVSSYFNKIKSEIIKELDLIGLVNEKEYVRYLNFWEKYIKSFSKYCTSLEDLNFFLEIDDATAFLMLSLPLVKNNQWFNDSTEITDAQINKELFISYNEIYCQQYQLENEETNISSLQDIFNFVNSTELCQNLKWKLMQIMASPQPYYQKLISVIKQNIPAYKKALSNVNTQYTRFIVAFEQASYENSGDYQAIFNGEVKQIIPSVVFIFLQIYFNKILFCGLLSNVVLKDENKHTSKKERLLSVLKAFSDNTKFDILLSLKKRPKYNLEMAEELKVTPGTMSHHMNALSSARLVDVEKKRGKVYYILNEENIKTFLNELERLLLH